MCGTAPAAPKRTRISWPAGVLRLPAHVVATHVDGQPCCKPASCQLGIQEPVEQMRDASYAQSNQPHVNVSASQVGLQLQLQGESSTFKPDSTCEPGWSQSMFSCCTSGNILHARKGASNRKSEEGSPLPREFLWGKNVGTCHLQNLCPWCPSLHRSSL